MMRERFSQHRTIKQESYHVFRKRRAALAHWNSAADHSAAGVLLALSVRGDAMRNEMRTRRRRATKNTPPAMAGCFD